MKVKMTVTKLLDLQRKRDTHRNNFNYADQKLRELCTHPKRFRSTDSVYFTDTLGNNGQCDYWDHCELCDRTISENYKDRANYPARKRIK